MGASHAFPVDSLRSPSFTAKMGGTASSIMDYARFNYVAQPGDGVKEITPKIGTYDKFAINWAYRWLDTETPQEELPILMNGFKSMKETRCTGMASNKTRKIRSILVLRMKTLR